MIGRKTIFLRQQIQGSQSAATCGHAGLSVREGVNNKVLQQSERLDGVGQTANAVHGIGDGAHVQRGFNEIGQRNVLDRSGLKGDLQGSLLCLRNFFAARFFGCFCFNIGY